jgi:hypothetical protein
MLLIDMDVTAPVTGTLEDLIAAWAPHDHAVTDGTCVVCEGETFRVELRGGLRAWACRECGSVLEDEPAAVAA